MNKIINRIIKNSLWIWGGIIATKAYTAGEVANVIVGSGEDKTSELTILTNIINTAQNIILYGIGPLIGTSMVLKGFKLVGQAERGEKGSGVMMIVCGGACFGLGPIIGQILKLFK